MAAARSFRSLFGPVAKMQTSFTQCQRSALLKRFKHTASLSKEPSSEPKNTPRWQLRAAVCLTRLPLVAPNLTAIEQSYLKMLEEQEFEKSILSDWEIEKNRQSELIKAIEMGDRESTDLDVKVTHQDVEDDNDLRFKEFEKLNPAATDDSNTRNMSRKLQESLTYVVRKRLGNDELWVLPSAPAKEGETMRDCAERALSTDCLNGLQWRILSNAPSAFFKYKFPKGVRLKNQGDFIGAKVFIFSAIAKGGGNPAATDTGQKMKQAKKEDNESDILDYAWVSKEELSKHLKPKYFEAVKNILS